MGLGTISSYKIGYNKYGVEIKRIFPERIVKRHDSSKIKYYPTEYYILYDCNKGRGKQVFILEEYKLNTLINKLMTQEHSVACINSQFQTEELIIKVLSRRQRKVSIYNKKGNKKRLPVYVVLRKRDLKTVKESKPKSLPLTKSRKPTAYHPTISWDRKDKKYRLDMNTYNLMKYSYIRHMKKYGMDPTLVEEIIMKRFLEHFSGTPKAWLKKQIA